MSLSGSYTASSSIPGYVPQPDGAEKFPPFNEQDDFFRISCEGNQVVPKIAPKIDKGFFFSSDHVWTCYRRNYFIVSVQYTLQPWAANSRLYLDQKNGKQADQIQCFAVSLAAAVDGPGGKSIELIQHTPKRDKGPQLAMKKELLAPMPPGKHEHSYNMGYHGGAPISGPILPLQSEQEGAQQQFSPASTGGGGNNHSHTFERIQFKSATANNGKRRAQQQYYHLIVELYANIQNPREENPRWVKVAARTSHPVVVRGRSPSHYQNEGPHSTSSSRGGQGGGPGVAPQGYAPGPGGQFTATYRNGLGGGGSSNLGSGIYRGTTYSLDPSPVGSHSVSSASSLSGGHVEGLVGDQHMVDDEDAKMNTSHDYSYFPSPIYAPVQPKAETTSVGLQDRRIKEEFPGPAATGASWQVGSCGRFQGMESSRGFYPDMHTHTHTGY